MPKKGTKKRERGADYINTLGGRLNEVLKTHPDPDTGKQMTQAKLAEILDLKSEKFISMVINNDRGMSRKNIEKIADKFCVRKEYLLLIDKFMTEEERERAISVNSAVKRHIKPLELAEELILSNGYLINDEHPETGIAILTPTGDMRIVSSGDYMKLLKSINNSLREKMFLLFAGTPVE